SIRTGTTLRGETAPTIPHMASTLSVFRFLYRSLPPRYAHLWRARQRQHVGRRFLCDRAPAADRRAMADPDWRDEHAVRPDRRVVLDHRRVLVRAVIVRGDGPCAEVDARSHRGVTDVREVIRLRAAADRARFHFDEIADVDIGGERRARPQSRIR